MKKFPYNKYKRLNYIQSSGTQYIQLNSGFLDTDEVEIKTKVAFTSSDKYLVSPTTWNTSTNRLAIGGAYDNKRAVGFGGMVTAQTKYTPIVTSEIGQITTERYADKLFTIAGNGINSSVDVTAVPFGGETDNLKLFYGYNTVTAGTIYYWKHKKVIDGALTLVENLVPAQRISDNAIGMYDLVNSGKNLFDKSNSSINISNGEYVESTGEYKASSSSTNRTIKIYLSAGTYTISRNLGSSTQRLRAAYYGSTEPVVGSVGTNLGLTLTAASGRFTIANDGWVAIWYASRNAGATADDILTAENTCQLELGSSVTAYEPYDGFYTNAGTGVFTAGNEIKESDSYKRIIPHYPTADIDGESTQTGTPTPDAMIPVVSKQPYNLNGLYSCGKVDLGTLNWIIRPGETSIFQTANGGQPSDMKFGVSGQLPSFYCAEYANATHQDVVSKARDRIIGENDNEYGTIKIYDTRFTNAADFKAAMSGKYLYYQRTTDSTWSVPYIDKYLANGLPSGYTELEYIQSSGTQYIDTGIKAQHEAFKVVIDSSLNGFHGMLGAQTSAGNASTHLIYNNRFYIGNNESVSTNIFSPTTRGTVILESTADKHYSITKYDGTIVTGTYTGTIINNKSYYLCGMNSTSVNVSATGKIYNIKFYDDGILVGNFIPARNSSNVVGMYDLVSGQFFTNAGTGTFTAGPEIATPRIVRNVGIKVLDGTESGWDMTPVDASGNHTFYRLFDDKPSGAISGLGFSTHYICKGISVNYLQIHIGEYCYNSVNSSMYFDGNGCASADEWKAYLAAQYANGTPVVVYYPLETPTVETAEAVKATSYKRIIPYFPTANIEGNSTQTGTPTPSAMIPLTSAKPYQLNGIGTYKDKYYGKGLPEGYTELEYLATQRNTVPTRALNTGISTASTDTSFIIESKNVSFFSKAVSNSRNMYGAEGSTIGILNGRLFPSDTNAAIDTFYKLKFVYTAGTGRVLYINDVLQSGTASDYHPANNVALFARGYSGNYYFEFLGTIGETTIWRDNAVVYHGCPCKRNSDNALGFYDLLTNTFVAGDSTLVAGPEIITPRIVRNVGVKILDGTESWTDASSDTKHIYYFPLPDRKVGGDDRHGLCSHFGYSTGTSSLCPDLNMFYYGSLNTGFRYDAITSVANWQAYLAAQYANGTPVVIYYPLTTPVVEEAKINDAIVYKREMLYTVD